jgi:aspartyl-tRNA(Asn)/glutamyl-tRNA(Gln) amidotransferase subunit C
MSVDSTTVRRIARLARIKVGDDEIEHLRDELSAMLAFVEQLSEVDVTGVEPMTSVTPTTLRQRADAVTDGGIAEAVLRNAPARQGDFFMVPKVVE